MKTIDIVKRSFNDILNAFVSLYPNLPDHIFREISANLETTNELINLIASDTLYPFSRFAAYGFAGRNDYSPTEADGATSQLTITLKAAGAKTLPIGHKVSGLSSITGQQCIYELIAVGDSGGTDTIVIDAKQQQSYTNVSLGNISGTENFSKYWIKEYTNVIKNSVILRIGGNIYTRVDNFDASGPTDRHFILWYDSYGKVLFILGDGVTGAKPANGDAIFADFAITLGSQGKVAAGDLTNDLSNDSDIDTITNADSNGGNDAESVTSIIRNAQANVRLRDGIFLIDDVENFVVSKSSLSGKIVKAHAIPGTGASLGTCNVDIITNDMVNLTAGEKTTLDAEATAITPFGVFPVYSQDPNYLNVAINATATVRSGFDVTITKNLIKFALQLISSPIDNYVIDYYETYGIDQTRLNIINTTFGHSFTDAQHAALSFIITEWVELLRGKSGRTYGMQLTLDDMYTVTNEMYDFGVGGLDITAPTADAAPTVDQIVKGTVTIS